jgi:glycosyltransferase involved in cell wall biosynthesis
VEGVCTAGPLRDSSHSLVALHIVIDSLAARFGGGAYAAVQVARHMADDPVVERVTVVTRRGSMVARGLRPPVRAITLPNVSHAELGHRLAWEATALPGRARRERADAVLTWSGMIPRTVRLPVIAYYANPLLFMGSGLGNAVRRYAARRTAGAAAAVLVPTRAFVRTAGAVLGRTPGVIPLGVDHDEFRPAATSGHEVLCVGDFYRHKRHDLVLDAWAALSEPRPPLRLIGDPAVDPTWTARLRREVERRSSLGRVVLEHGVSLHDLVAAYHRARVIVVASHYESFCMPLLEAQACGVPAVARSDPALRETGGPGTTYVAGSDVNDWSAALASLLADEDAYAHAREVGLQHAAGYGWDRTAKGIRDRLLEAVG